MGAPKADMSAERSIGAQQNQQAQWAIGQGQSAIDKMGQLQDPLVQYYKSQMTNQASRTASNAVPLGQIAQGNAQARQNILDTSPAGAARDVTVAGLKRDQSAQTSGLLNSAYLAAPGGLAGLGSQQGQLGTALTGQGGGLLSGASTTFGNVAQQQAQANQGWMNALLGVAGIAGNIGSAAIKRQTTDPTGGFSDVYAGNSLGNGQFGAGPQLPPAANPTTSFMPQWNQSGYAFGG